MSTLREAPRETRGITPPATRGATLPPRANGTHGSDAGPTQTWLVAGVTVAAFGVALAGLQSLLDGVAWWFVAFAVVVIVIGASAVTVSYLKRMWVALIAPAAAVVVLTGFFAAAESIAWIIPTFSSAARFTELSIQGRSDIASDSVPADPTTGIVFLVCVGAAVLAALAAFVALGLRRPALVGIPLLALVLVPSIVRARLGDPVVFVITAALWLVLVYLSTRSPQRVTAVVVGIFAVIAALIAPVILPPVSPDSDSSGAPGFSTGLNPIIDLGNDLRRASAVTALSYETNATASVYLRLTVIEDFSGDSWAPEVVSPEASNSVGEFGAIPGLTSDIPNSEITTSVDVRNIFGRWLPTPYPTLSIDGLVGRWLWEPSALAVRSSNSSIRGQKYDITSLELRPTVEQLRAAPRPSAAILERDAAPVDGLPQSVIDEAIAVTSAATTDYDRAMALQNYFRSGEFLYSEDAPVEGDYDGAGIQVLAPFLEQKSGYCVHYSAAMAVMARVLGIPSRVAVGFLPGDPTTDAETEVTTFTVTSHDLHAWPELYFEGIGWMRFEPTPGRGSLPNYEATIPDDPATPSVDESVPTAEPTAAAPTVAPDLPDEVVPNAAPTTASSAAIPALRVIGISALALLLLSAPALVRLVVRRRRLRAARMTASALPAWSEIRATATDLGLDLDDADTPREASARLPQSDALDRVVAKLESESFAREGGVTLLDVGVDTADVTAVLASMEGSTSFATRLRARFLARSLVVNSRVGER